MVDAAGHLHGVLDVGLFEDEMEMLAQGRVADNVFQLIGVHLAQPSTPIASFRDRFPWLLANITGGLVCALLASRWEPLLDAVVVLALFIPVVLALSESVSIQAVSLTLQALHSEPPGARFLRRALVREVVTAAMLGAACGALVGGAAWLWQGDARVATVIFGAILLAMITACLFGVALPTTMRLLKWDPRVAAGPIVLAIGDVAALTFYFAIGARLLM